MAFLSRSRLFGLLLILASLPMDPGSALATGMAAPGGDGTRSGDPGESAPADVMEARLRRIAAAVQAQRPQDGSGAVDDDALSYVYVGPGGVGWGNGGWGNGGFRNGGFYNGGFGNGGFRNGGFWNGGFRNGGWGNGGGFRNGGFRNHW